MYIYLYICIYETLLSKRHSFCGHRFCGVGGRSRCGGAKGGVHGAATSSGAGSGGGAAKGGVLGAATSSGAGAAKSSTISPSMSAHGVVNNSLDRAQASLPSPMEHPFATSLRASALRSGRLSPCWPLGKQRAIALARAVCTLRVAPDTIISEDKRLIKA